MGDTAANLAGWWLGHPSENMKVNWDDEISNIWENKKWQPNHQPAGLPLFGFLTAIPAFDYRTPVS